MDKKMENALREHIDQLQIPLFIEAHELSHPVSLKRDGTIATLADLIASTKDEVTKAEFRKVFGNAIPEAPADIISVAELDNASMAQVAVAIFSRRKPDELYITSGMFFNQADGIKNIEELTPVGLTIINDFFSDNFKYERAVEVGKVKPTIAPTVG